MNIQESVEKSLKVWTHIYENNLTSKDEAYTALGLSEDKSYCALCQYTTEHSTVGCDGCPAKNYWTPIDTNEHSIPPCVWSVEYGLY